ncbi:pyridoxamine 5'-phosphate oxidase family protein [Chloroflexota bacterium]
MATMSKVIVDLVNDPQASKVLATSDVVGKVNVVPKGTIAAIDDETLIFGDIMGDKTNANLKVNNKVAVTVFKLQMPPVGYQIKGTFQGFQTSGPVFDNVSTKVKQALKMDIRSVGVIKVDEVYSAAPPNAGARLA